MISRAVVMGLALRTASGCPNSVTRNRAVMLVVGAGAAIGLVLAAVGGRLIATMLFGVRPLDPTTFVLVTTVLLVTAALSIIAPAWRAARIDPAVALRTR